MSINITDMTPEVSRLELVKISDVYGRVLVIKGWR